ncbi:hypothetical protein JI435_142130, partial [Parastagonospora nodorum SN15]
HMQSAFIPRHSLGEFARLLSIIPKNGVGASFHCAFHVFLFFCMVLLERGCIWDNGVSRVWSISQHFISRGRIPAGSPHVYEKPTICLWIHKMSLLPPLYPPFFRRLSTLESMNLVHILCAC